MANLKSLAPEKIFVVAGNHDQFWQFQRQLAEYLSAEGFQVRRSDIVYVSTPDVLRGYERPWGYLVGTWEKREDIWQIVDQINCRRSSITNDFIDVQHLVTE